MGHQMFLCKVQVRKRHQMLELIINVVNLIGKRGLGSRGSQSEAAYMLKDDTVDHGNFLEMIVLLSKYDFCLKEDLTICIKNSKKLHQSGSRGGRGFLVTFLSKATINNIIKTIQHIMKTTIASQVQESGMFSVQIDTTQDITSQDQCSVIIRYVTDIVHEKLVALIQCESSTGQYFVKVVSEVLANMNLDLKQCIGNSTDGASNMQGKYKGFSTHLSEKSPHQIHVCCYSLIHNLILEDTTQSVLESGSFFFRSSIILQFLSESYQRMSIWEKEKKDPKHRRLAPIGETRWWPKDSALNKFFRLPHQSQNIYRQVAWTS
ncbi:zinc finger MYM-type protein 6-like [Girardinichthys multiradiatus]|uniref:zinc finger MYM-type protein 6-like n=1 Tax=Girardinichthys multiradiatus TaxID=208333 RepID=UPI001FABF50C|nr:zinc finger MYM-type protein 6-like [Girardinichthys multiradiatus]